MGLNKLVEYLAAELGIANKTLLEKDILLHRVLCGLLEDEFFKANFVFKGGTCLTKCYLGYYRFSEDLDFTWIRQEEFYRKSQKELRKILSAKMVKIIAVLQLVAAQTHLDFNPDKANRRYIELGGSNKFCTFKLWYPSALLDQEQMIKVQINFVEFFQYPFRKCPARSLLENLKTKEFHFLFPEEAVLLRKPELECYSLKEILVEKFRAILTRRNVKARDFIDIFLIANKEQIDPVTLRKKIIEKTAFMLRYDKYLQNLRNFQLEKFVLGEEKKLLLKPLPKGFALFLQEMPAFIIGMAEDLQQKSVKARGGNNELLR